MIRFVIAVPGTEITCVDQMYEAAVKRKGEGGRDQVLLLQQCQLSVKAQSVDYMDNSQGPFRQSEDCGSGDAGSKKWRIQDFREDSANTEGRGKPNYYFAKEFDLNRWTERERGSCPCRPPLDPPLPLWCVPHNQPQILHKRVATKLISNFRLEWLFTSMTYSLSPSSFDTVNEPLDYPLVIMLLVNRPDTFFTQFRSLFTRIGVRQGQRSIGKTSVHGWSHFFTILLKMITIDAFIQFYLLIERILDPLKEM